MKKLLSFPFFALSILAAQGAVADEFKIIPYASLREEYNDNIYFSDDTKEEDFVTTAAMGLEVRERTELLNSKFIARFNGLSYADHSELNDIEEFYNGQLTYQLNPFLKLSADAGYSVDSRPDRDLDITGYIFNSDVRRRQNYSCSADYQASEKTSLFSSYSFLEDQFEVDKTDEFTGQNVLLGLLRSLDLTKPTTARLYGHYAHYDFYSSKVDNYSLTAGFSRQVSEKLSYVFDIGPRYTEGREKRGSNTVYDDGIGGQFTITYAEQLTTFNLNLTHEITGSSGRDGATKRTGLTFAVKHRIGERSTIRLNIDSYLNKTDRSQSFVSDLNELTTTFTPSLYYEFNPSLSCETSYRYTVVDDREQDNEKHRNLVFFKLTYRYPVVE